MYNVGRLIQQLQNYDKELNLQTLLDKEEFASFLQTIYKSLPMESKSKAQRLFRPTKITKRKRPQNSALTTILGIRSIALPDGIKNTFQRWENDPSQFWMAHEAQLGIHWDSGVSFENAATKAYVAVQHLSLRRPWDTILWRFYTSFFYMLGLMLAHGATYKTDNMYHRLLTALRQSENITDECTVIEENLRSWTAAGSKYHKICLRLGKGALFLLPNVPDKVWEEERSLTGAAFDRAMTHLEQQGIKTLSAELGADILSDRILNSALNSFRWDDPSSSDPTLNTSVADVRRSAISINSTASNSNLASISTLLNAADYIAGSTQGQELPLVGRSSILESSSSGIAVDRFASEFAPPLSTPSSGIINNQGVSANSTPEVTYLNRGSQATGAPWVETIGMKIARTAEVEQLEISLGVRLFEAMDTSRMRHLEKAKRWMTLTDTVCLHVPTREGEDFKLELWLATFFGKLLLQATSSAEDSRNLLGDYIFEGMKASNRIMVVEEGLHDFTSAVNVYFPDGDNGGDCKVEIMLNYRVGFDVLRSVYS